MERHYLPAKDEEITVEAGTQNFTATDFISKATFLYPDWLKRSAWVEHVPFAFWIIDALRPRVFVELGTHKGTSFFAFCQAVQTLGLETQCAAVGTGEGDLYGKGVFEGLSEYHQERYASFSSLIRSTSDEALTQFKDGTIDLLHIDGLHTYEAVKHDFESWLPKLSPRAVVLFHGTHEDERGGGVHKFWSELKRRYPSFEFFHGNGLGIAGVGTDLPDVAKRLFLAGENPSVAATVRDVYEALGKMKERELASQTEAACLKDEAFRSQNKRIQLEYELSASIEATQQWQSKALVLKKTVKSALRWQQRSWITRAFHRWRPRGSDQQKRGFLRKLEQSIRKRRKQWGDQLLNLFQKSAFPWPKRFSERCTKSGNLLTIFFDEGYYKSQARKKRSGKTSWWDDYLQTGWKRGLNPHPLFDVKWYLENNPEVKASGEEPLGHYLHKGWKEGCNPNPYFQTEWYIANNPEVLELNVNPLLHYFEEGWKNGRDPSPVFSVERYFKESPHVERTVDPLSEYLKEIADGKAPRNTPEYVHWPVTYIPSDIELLPKPSIGKIAVQLHAFYLDKLDVILDHLKYIPAHFDLLVSTDTEDHAHEIEQMVEQSKLDCSLDIRCSENRGRDVAPLISLFGRKLLDYDCALHLHTKKSVIGRSDANLGHKWLMHNLGFLVRNEEYVRGILSFFHHYPKCGVLAPKPWLGIRQVIKWTTNRQHAEMLMERLHLPQATLKTQPLMFPAGTMFWFRPAALKPLLSSDLQFGDFPPEPIPNDGTLAHAIERCILYIALSQGYHSLIVAPSIYKPIA